MNRSILFLLFGITFIDLCVYRAATSQRVTAGKENSIAG